MRIAAIPREEWATYLAEGAHQAVFGEAIDPAKDKSDYTLVVEDDMGTAIIYTTVTEMTTEDVCMEFGGSFPAYRGSRIVPRAFAHLIRWFREAGYKSVGYITRNDNYPMLKLGFSAGFKIMGCHLTDRGLVVQSSLNLEENSNVTTIDGRVGSTECGEGRSSEAEGCVVQSRDSGLLTLDAS